MVRLWFREAERALPALTEGEARAAAEGLIAALDGKDYAVQRLKVLVGSPLLLTLLCVVVLHGGEMPKQRVQFYDQCLRILLGKWAKAMKGGEPLLDAEAALALLRPLAYRLHAGRRRDDLSKLELIDELEERLEALGRKESSFRVLEWLHRRRG